MLCILRSVVYKLLETLFTWHLTEKCNEDLQIMEYLSYFLLFEKILPLATLARQLFLPLFSKSSFS